MKLLFFALQAKWKPYSHKQYVQLIACKTLMCIKLNRVKIENEQRVLGFHTYWAMSEGLKGEEWKNGRMTAGKQGVQLFYLE